MRACLPDLALEHFISDQFEQCRITVNMSNRPKDAHLEDLVSARRGYRKSPGEPDRYDKKLDLYYFNVDLVKEYRVFIRPRSLRRGFVFGQCGIGYPYPQCKFHTYSSVSKATLSIGLPMKDIQFWERWMQEAERHLMKFQLAEKGVNQ